jgi:hypothetical protein
MLKNPENNNKFSSKGRERVRELYFLVVIAWYLS